MDSTVIVGDNNVVNKTTIIQKFFNIFKSDTESMEQRNRRILLNHVENAWIKGVLDASLHGAALLDLGIKQDPEAVTKYPWAIKKESTDETLPAGISMLEIFDSIGMGRSLLILGAPGSGKTTMLLELARQLIQHAREDVTYPIPMVFNLASWNEKLTLADWLAQELNNLYSVPRKTAPDWVKGNKLLLLLDGLDEVQQESRAKCVDAINAFRKEHGLTSLAVCSRSQDYADLNAKLSFEGAIEVQPLTQEQITEFFNRFGKEMAGIKQALEKDNALREMAETPLFLSIMLMAYRDKQDVDIWVSQDEKVQRKHLFDTYIERMFERRSENAIFKKQNVLHWLSWLAKRLNWNSETVFLSEHMQPDWLSTDIVVRWYGLWSRIVSGLIVGVILASFIGQIHWLLDGVVIGLLYGIVGGLSFHSKFMFSARANLLKSRVIVFFVIASLGGLYSAMAYIFRFYPFKAEASLLPEIYSYILLNSLTDGIFYGFVGVIFYEIVNGSRTATNDIQTVEALKWSWKSAYQGIISGVGIGIMIGFTYGFILGIIFFIFEMIVVPQYGYNFIDGVMVGTRIGLFCGSSFGIGVQLRKKLISKELERKNYVNQGIWLSLRNGVLVGSIITGFNTIIFMSYAVIASARFGAARSFVSSALDLNTAFLWGISSGIVLFLFFGGYTVVQHVILRFFLWRDGAIPLKYIPFLNHCVDLIFLRRVGGGYIFVHRLLMEHFAEMYVETPTSKGNKK